MSFPGDNYVVPGANPGGGGGVSSLTAGTGITITGPPSTPTISVSNYRPTYTLYVAPNGNDTTGDGSILNPYASIQQALLFRAAFPASVVYEIFLFPGSYTGNIFVATGNTYFTANSSPYRDLKSAVITGNVMVDPSVSGGINPTAVGFTNMEFSLSSFASAT
jgi:hypothetical protein